MSTTSIFLQLHVHVSYWVFFIFLEKAVLTISINVSFYGCVSESDARTNVNIFSLFVNAIISKILFIYKKLTEFNAVLKM